MATPAALVSLVEEHPAEEHLDRIVDQESVLQLEGLAIPHVTRSCVQAEVQVGSKDHEQRSGGIRKEPLLKETHLIS